MDAISSPEFSAASNSLVQTNNMDPTFQAFKHRALSAFNRNEVSEIFGKVGFRKSQGELLQNYNEISTLPMKQRKASFRNASARKKSEFWKTQLALYLAMHPELNDGQKEIILVAMSLVPPQWFEIPSDDPSWKVRVEEPLREFESRILAFFSKEEGARIFATLGDPETSVRGFDQGGSISSQIISYVHTNASDTYRLNRFVEQGQDIEIERSGDCVCSSQSDWCWNYCGGSGCNHTTSGCGTFWSYPCNGARCN